MAMSPMQRIYITLEPKQIEQLRLIEKVRGMSISEQIREALTPWVDAHDLKSIRAELGRRTQLDAAVRVTIEKRNRRVRAERLKASKNKR
jgi:ribbon-helix-helix CopG family protein